MNNAAETLLEQIATAFPDKETIEAFNKKFDHTMFLEDFRHDHDKSEHQELEGVIDALCSTNNSYNQVPKWTPRIMRLSRGTARLPMEFLVLNRFLPFIKKYVLLRYVLDSRALTSFLPKIKDVHYDESVQKTSWKHSNEAASYIIMNWKELLMHYRHRYAAYNIQKISQSKRIYMKHFKDVHLTSIWSTKDVIDIL